MPPKERLEVKINVSGNVATREISFQLSIARVCPQDDRSSQRRIRTRYHEVSDRGYYYSYSTKYVFVDRYPMNFWTQIGVVHI